MKQFAELTEREMLALAISNKEKAGRIYTDFAKALREDQPDSGRIFVDMAKAEGEHRRELIGLFVPSSGITSSHPARWASEHRQFSRAR